ncbi:hypothetical protein [Sulfitobacter sp. PS-8MA]|uniref:hypothetical protein n=1 Tax=Sulfitobacter sp. PS-8MA TaxID=3237707 RepID=UPI0034C654BE
MTRMIFPLFAAAALSGCASLSDSLGLGGGTPEPTAAPAPAEASAATGAAAELTTGANTADSLDSTTKAQREAAAEAPAAPGATLGETIVSLGSATEPGLWLKTPLVSREQPGRVTNPATGKSATVTLIPIEGPPTAGSRMSLPALRLIGASLTDLTPVEVSAAG